MVYKLYRDVLLPKPLNPNPSFYIGPEFVGILGLRTLVVVYGLGCRGSVV